MVIYTKKNNEKSIKGLSICTGLGGLELGVGIAEPRYRTICYIERESYCAATLVERMEKQELHTAPIWSDVTTFDGKPWCGKVDIITGGYPCQPFSIAGKKLAKADERHLWPYIRNIVAEIQPKYCFFENVEGHVDRGFKEVATDLATLGYTVKAGLFTASEVGASHRRTRLFILADANSNQQRRYSGNSCQKRSFTLSKSEVPIFNKNGSDSMEYSMGYVNSNGLQMEQEEKYFPPKPSDFAAWQKRLKNNPYIKPAIFRGNDGVAYRVERYHAAGNGVVPLQAAYAWYVLKNG